MIVQKPGNAFMKKYNWPALGTPTRRDYFPDLQIISRFSDFKNSL